MGQEDAATTEEVAAEVAPVEAAPEPAAADAAPPAVTEPAGPARNYGPNDTGTESVDVEGKVVDGKLELVVPAFHDAIVKVELVGKDDALTEVEWSAAPVDGAAGVSTLTADVGVGRGDVVLRVTASTA